jgi:hypothetical protein
LDIHPKIKKLPHALRIPDASELRQQSASLCHHFANEPSFALCNDADSSHIVSRASSDQPLDALKLDGDSSPFE